MDVVAVLNKARIAYVEHGPNVKKGNVNIRCPICGEDDPGEHLGINLASGKWGCWRNKAHCGKSLHSLLHHFMGPADAKIVLGDQRPDPEAFEAAVALLDNPAAVFDKPRVLSFPREARTFDANNKRKSSGHPFGGYLFDRGFTDPWDAAYAFHLRYCITGDFSRRILFPVFNLDFDLIGWTGRAIVPAEIRYKAYPLGNAIKTSVFNLPSKDDRNQRLVICEGPMDAMKVNWYSNDAWAIGLMGTSATAPQVNLIARLASQFHEVNILLDADAQQQAMMLQSQLSFLNPSVLALPPGVKDPGDLTARQVENLIG